MKLIKSSNGQALNIHRQKRYEKKIIPQIDMNNTEKLDFQGLEYDRVIF